MGDSPLSLEAVTDSGSRRPLSCERTCPRFLGRAKRNPNGFLLFTRRIRHGPLGYRGEHLHRQQIRHGDPIRRCFDPFARISGIPGRTTATVVSKGAAKLGRRIADDYIGSGAMDQLVRYVNLESCSEIEAARKLLEFLMLTTTGRHPTLAQQKDRKAIDRALYFLRTNFPLLLEDCCRA